MLQDPCQGQETTHPYRAVEPCLFSPGQGYHDPQIDHDVYTSQDLDQLD